MGWATLISPVGPEWSGAVGWATLISPVGPEWSGAVGWATLISPVVPGGAVLWAGRPLLAPWSRVERCCVLAGYYLGAWVLSQFVLQKQRAAAASASSGGGGERCVRGVRALARRAARHDR